MHEDLDGWGFCSYHCFASESQLDSDTDQYQLDTKMMEVALR